MDLNLETLRIFCVVVENGSFSGAARALGVTQPTVSQHIARIEQILGGRVFQRVGRAIHLTRLGRDFLSFAREAVDRADRFVETIKDQRSAPSGLVRYAMPESCQWTPHYRKIMSRIRDYPGISFQIGILPNERITRLLLEGKIDFGFVTGSRSAPELRFEKFSDEHYSLVAADVAFFEPLRSKSSSEPRLISYPGWELFFRAWASAHGPVAGSKRLPSPIIHVGTLAGAIHAVQEGAGAAVIPTHCVAGELRSGALKAFVAGRTEDATNPIHLVRRSGEVLAKRAQLVMDMLREAKADLKARPL